MADKVSHPVNSLTDVSPGHERNNFTMIIKVNIYFTSSESLKSAVSYVCYVRNVRTTFFFFTCTQSEDSCRTEVNVD